MAKAATKSEKVIEITPVRVGRIRCHVLGVTPLILHRFAAKTIRELVLPKGRANAAEKAENLKHDPLMEYRECLYINRDESEPAAFHLPTRMFSAGIASAALDLPGATKSQLLRLVSISSTQINLYGVPRMHTAMVRMSDMNRTPDVRFRPVFSEWACQVDIEFVASLIKENQIVNLLAAAGIIIGAGDWRKQKGGEFGKYTIVDEDNLNYRRIINEQGRGPQIAAFQRPENFDLEGEELYAWFNEEVARREKVIPSSMTAMPPSARTKTNGNAKVQQ